MMDLFENTFILLGGAAMAAFALFAVVPRLLSEPSTTSVFMGVVIALLSIAAIITFGRKITQGTDK